MDKDPKRQNIIPETDQEVAEDEAVMRAEKVGWSEEALAVERKEYTSLVDKKRELYAVIEAAREKNDNDTWFAATQELKSVERRLSRYDQEFRVASVEHGEFKDDADKAAEEFRRRLH